MEPQRDGPQDGAGLGQEPLIRAQGPLWAGFRGSVRLDALHERVVIDLVEYSDERLNFKVRGGGDRVYGLRWLRVDPGILANQRGFFQALRVSIAENGVKLPILVYGINGRLYVRYGASRVHTARELGFDRIPAVLCLLNGDRVPDGFLAVRRLETPEEVLRDGFGSPRIVGSFQCDHERIDGHRMEPR